MRFCLPATSIRVWLNTDKEINEAILETILDNIRYYSGKSMDDITQRQLELDEEWDTERIFETGTATLVLLSTLIACLSKNKAWTILSGLSGAFLLQHALHGWMPALSCIRGMGVRTQTEIMAEKTLLEVLKEDPQYLSVERIREIVTSVI